MRYADSPLRATCDRCGTDCGVLESRTQATRHEPSRSLGFNAFCPECQVTFPAPEPQPTLAPCGATWSGLRPGNPDCGCGWGELCTFEEADEDADLSVRELFRKYYPGGLREGED